jgi:hypothetical protein
MSGAAPSGTRERPIIFDAESIGAIRAGGKTQTRRVVSLPKAAEDGDPVRIERWIAGEEPHLELRGGGRLASPYGRRGDRLWVKETHLIRTAGEGAGREGEDDDAHLDVLYREATPVEQRSRVRWRTPLFMPRWAARLILDVVEVRAERLQALTAEDAVAEGMHDRRTARTDFSARWDGLNAKRGFPWADDPWVWVLTFRPVTHD